VTAEMKHLVHITPSFAPGGAQVRIVQLMNHFGRRYRHTVLSLDDRLQASARISPGVRADCGVIGKTANPCAMTLRFIRQLQRLKPDLVLTYNWGSMDGAGAAALLNFPMVHTEDGFGPDEAHCQKARRVWMRRMVLRGAAHVVAPSLCLANIMKAVWRLPERKVAYIPNGVDVDRFAPGGRRTKDEFVIGTIGHLRCEKNLGLLIRTAAELSRRLPVRLKIIGDGPERATLEREAHERGIADRVEFLGWREDISTIYQEFDLFALSSTTEQMPLSVLEAMACGLPVVSTNVGDVGQMVAASNRPLVVPATQFSRAMHELAIHPERRYALGAANRARAVNVYSIARMFKEYDRLYESVLENRGQRAPKSANADKGFESQHGLSQPE
jgi:glycosyltransferase involved in cell wall biosynthesis